jgi:monofunctional biosynthetic peptidoglycan transglycosylase
LGSRTLKKIGVASAILVVGFWVLIFLLRWVPVPTSAFMIGQLLNGKTYAYQWVPWSKITPTTAIAVIASEDQNFPFHWGFDFKAIAQAVEENENRKNPRGASTISQQVAKNLFLWSGRSWLRKGLEAIVTVAIELAWPKQRILEVYLNVAQFGPKAFGLQAGSQYHFGIPQSRLTARQAALLAAVLPNPSDYRADPPSPNVARRAAFIQQQVRHLGGPAYLKQLRE